MYWPCYRSTHLSLSGASGLGDVSTGLRASDATLLFASASSLVFRMDCFSSSSSCNEKWKLLSFSVEIVGGLNKNCVLNVLPVNNKIQLPLLLSVLPPLVAPHPSQTLPLVGSIAVRCCCQPGHCQRGPSWASPPAQPKSSAVWISVCARQPTK